MSRAPTWAILLALPVLLRILKTRRLPSRETIILPKDERVVLLGASSGVGRDLAHIYAKRGAKVCIVARRKDSLEEVKRECVELGCDPDNVLVVSEDLTKPEDLVNIREAVIKAWGGLDTLHILAGVPFTWTLMDLAGVQLDTNAASSSIPNASARHRFESEGGDSPTLEGLRKVAQEARACSEANFVGPTLALAAFLPVLASTSRSPAVHYLSSVAATVNAPRRTIYSATKAAGLMAVESCRVECEGCGVRFFSLLPGTIDNGFRKKSATSQDGGQCEVEEGVKHTWDRLLLKPETVTDTIMQHLSLSPSPTPLIPYLPFSLLSFLKTPPKSLVYLPWQYRAAHLMSQTPLGWLYVEPSARRKYGLPN